MAEDTFPEKVPVMRGIGKVIRDCRLACGLSLPKLAEKSDIDRTYLGHVEAGWHSPSLTLLWRLAKALEVLPSQMILSVEKEVEQQRRSH